MAEEYTDIKFEIKGQIGIIKVSDTPTATGSDSQSTIHPELKLTSHQFNRPKALNSFGGYVPNHHPTPSHSNQLQYLIFPHSNLIPDTIAALRVLNEHPSTIFTVITGEGRFFSAGADVRGIASITEVRPLRK